MHQELIWQVMNQSFGIVIHTTSFTGRYRCARQWLSSATPERKHWHARQPKAPRLPWWQGVAPPEPLAHFTIGKRCRPCPNVDCLAPSLSAKIEHFQFRNNNAIDILEDIKPFSSGPCGRWQRSELWPYPPGYGGAAMSNLL